MGDSFRLSLWGGLGRTPQWHPGLLINTILALNEINYNALMPYSTAISQNDTCSSWVVGKEFGHIVDFATDNNPARAPMAMFGDLRSVQHDCSYKNVKRSKEKIDGKRIEKLENEGRLLSLAPTPHD